MRYIKGLGWIDETPKRGIRLKCQEDGCSKEWEAEFPWFTEAEIAQRLPEGEPLLSWCERHDLSLGYGRSDSGSE
jgi:hypothetical protein